MQDPVRSTQGSITGQDSPGRRRRRRRPQGEGQGGPESIPPSPPDTENPALAGFFVSAEKVGQMLDPVRSTRVRLLRFHKRILKSFRRIERFLDRARGYPAQQVQVGTRLIVGP